MHRPRELTHDAQVYRAYLKDADRLREEGAFIRRVILDNELKREYQQFLQERNRGKSESDGRPDRTPEENRSVGVLSASDLLDETQRAWPVEFTQVTLDEFRDLLGQLCGFGVSSSPMASSAPVS